MFKNNWIKTHSMKFKSLYARYFAVLIGLAIVIQAATIAVWQYVTGVFAWAATAGVTVLAAGLAFVAAKLLAKNLTDPLKTFISAAETVEKGEKADIIKLNREDEVSDLADAMNRLIDRDKAVRQANEDPLTGLANRRYLTQRLEQLTKKQTPLSMMFIDLDGFKPINDDFGHEVGDEALKMVSARLGTCIRESDVLSRIGGDEFVIMFAGLTDREILRQRAEKVLELVNQPYWINGNRVRMGASLGIAISPDDGTNPEEILNAADESMYAAKEGGKNGFRFYS